MRLQFQSLLASLRRLDLQGKLVQQLPSRAISTWLFAWYLQCTKWSWLQILSGWQIQDWSVR